MSTTQEILDAIFKKNEVPLSGRTVKLKKVSVRTLKPVIDLIAAVLEDLKQQGGPVTIDLQGSPEIILKLISNHYEEVVALVPVLTDMTEDEVYELDPADSITLVNAIVLLNQDFFTKTVLPALGLAKDVRAAAL